MGFCTKAAHFLPEIWTFNPKGAVLVMLYNVLVTLVKLKAVQKYTKVLKEPSCQGFLSRQLKNTPQREFEMPHWELKSMYYSLVIELTLPSSLIFWGHHFLIEPKLKGKMERRKNIILHYLLFRVSVS